ncbi:MAG: hypothetical protein KGS48_05695 [Bacteroidetes bacterium]|nr:hypothetical protein [Bacteroidota bacterium]
MIYLFLSVICSVLLGFAFKLFPWFGVDRFQAIVFNYGTCVVCGWLQMGQFPLASAGWDAHWVPYAVFLGFVFISGFNLAALTVQHFGVTVSQVMQKMSILLSVPFAVIVYHESAGLGKITGFLMAITAIILVNWPQPQAEKQSGNLGMLWLPALTWLLSGAIEVVLLHVQHLHLNNPQDPSFVSTIFGTAGAIGFFIAMIQWMRGKARFALKNVLGGICLGIPNYGSMLFMVMALGSGLESSLVFPAIDVSIILLTTIGAVQFFREPLARINWIGIALALAAILLIAF